MHMGYRHSASRALSTLRCVCPTAIFLPGFAAGQVAALVVAQYFGAYAPAAAWCSSALGVLLALRFSARSAGFFTVQFLALCCGAGSAGCAFSRAVSPASGIPNLALVDAEPRHKVPGGVELSLAVAPFYAGAEGGRAPVRVLCKAPNLPWRDIARADEGSMFVMRARFQRIKPDINPFSFGASLFRRGYTATCKIDHASLPMSAHTPPFARLKEGIIRRVEDVLGDGEEAGLFLSMSIGVRDMLSDSTEQGFRDAGLMQLLVVSGYQVSLVFYAARFMLRRVIFAIPWLRRGTRGYYAAAFLPVIPAMAFVVTVGIEGSSLRAGIAAMLLALSVSLERRGGLLNGICTSFVLLSVIWPACVLDPGIELTYAALLGIWVGSCGGKKGQAAFLSVSFWGTLFPSLLGIAWFDNLSLIGFVLNPLLGFPASVVSCDGGIFAMLLLYAHVPGAELIIRVISGTLVYFRDAVLYAAALPFSSIQPQGAVRWILFGAGSCAAGFFAMRRVAAAAPASTLVQTAPQSA
jgi:predicted membrane metal-binding protein